MFDRRYVQYFDWGLLGLAVLLGSLGLLMLYSAVMSDGTVCVDIGLSYLINNKIKEKREREEKE